MSDDGRVVVSVSLRDELSAGVARAKEQLRSLKETARTIPAGSAGVLGASSPQQFRINQNFSRLQQRNASQQQTQEQRQMSERLRVNRNLSNFSQRANQQRQREDERQARSAKAQAQRHPFVTLGKDLLGSNQFAKVGSTVSKALNGLSPPFKSFVENISGGNGLLATLGPAALAIGAFTVGIQLLRTAAEATLNIIKSLVSQGLSSGGVLEKSRLVIGRFDGGDAKQTEALLNQFRLLSNTPGLDLPGLTEAYRQLTAGGGTSPAEASKLIKSISDVSALSSNPASTMDALVNGFVRIQSTGRIDSRNARTLSLAGVDIYGQIARDRGYTDKVLADPELGKLAREHMKKLLDAGDVHVTQGFMKAFEDQTGYLGGSKGGAGQMQGTIGGLFRTIRNSFSLGLGDAAQGTIKALEKSFGSGAKLSDAVRKLGTDIGKPLFQAIETFVKSPGFKMFLMSLPQMAKALADIAPTLGIVAGVVGATFSFVSAVIIGVTEVFRLSMLPINLFIKAIEDLVNKVEQAYHDLTHPLSAGNKPKGGLPFPQAGPGAPHAATKTAAIVGGGFVSQPGSQTAILAAQIDVHPGAVVVHGADPKSAQQAAKEFVTHLNRHLIDLGERSGTLMGL